MPEIIVKYQDKAIERFVTEKRRVTVGRTPDNDIVLDNRGVSRRHSVIEFSDRQAVIIDNESLNGTFVNSRKISEEVLKDNDVITIGKYNLIYHQNENRDDNVFGLDGTMVLKTKQQRELLAKDKVAKQLTSEAGCSILLGEAGTEKDRYLLDRAVTTIGSSKLAGIKAKGWFVSGVQAKVVQDGTDYWIVNLGRKSKTMVNGETTERHMLKNDDLLQIGKTLFRFIENRV